MEVILRVRYTLSLCPTPGMRLGNQRNENGGDAITDLIHVTTGSILLDKQKPLIIARGFFFKGIDGYAFEGSLSLTLLTMPARKGPT